MKKNLSTEEKEWLRNQCIDPIINSSLRRIKIQEKLMGFPLNLMHIIRTSAIFALNKFASNGIEFDLNGKEINIASYANEIATHFNLERKREFTVFICRFLSDIQQYCFREIQALQIVKLEYSKLSHDDLREKVIYKLGEEYLPPYECNNGNGMNEHELIQHNSEMNIFMENCKKLKRIKSPL